MIEVFALFWCIGWLVTYAVLCLHNAPLTENLDESKEDI